MSEDLGWQVESQLLNLGVQGEYFYLQEEYVESKQNCRYVLELLHVLIR